MIISYLSASPIDDNLLFILHFLTHDFAINLFNINLFCVRSNDIYSAREKEMKSAVSPPACSYTTRRSITRPPPDFTSYIYEIFQMIDRVYLLTLTDSFSNNLIFINADNENQNMVTFVVVDCFASSL